MLCVISNHIVRALRGESEVNIKKLLALFILLIGVKSLPALPVTLYYNYSPTMGDTNAIAINHGNSVINSFSLSADATVDFAWIYIWEDPSGQPLQTVNWYIRNDDGGGNPFNGSLAGSGVATTWNNYVRSGAFGSDIYHVYIPMNVSLNGGVTYWFQLDSAVTANNDYIYWDVSGGPSQAYSSTLFKLEASESFVLMSDSSTVPEPSTVMLLSSGLLLGGLFQWRKAAKKIYPAIASRTFTLTDL
jgi:hypothetical protein